ncbi:MAG: hypothetical protein D6727_10920, partial [Gammaproteobacteria bacterium]
DGSTAALVYDDADNLLQLVDENGHITAMSYDANGNLAAETDPAGNTTMFAYDGNDRLISITDPLGNQEVRSYDALGRLASVTDRNGNTRTQAYDVRGRLVAVTDASGQTWSRAYDSEGVISVLTDPVGRSFSFESDSLGRLIRVTTPAGHSATRSYDPMGRIATISDALGRTVTYSYEARGLLERLTLSDGSTASYSYDALGNLTAAVDPAGNTWTSSYDNQGRLISYTDPLANVEQLEYDSRNRIRRVIYPGGLGTQDISYDPVGNIVGRSYSDGTTLSYSFDANDRLTAADGLSLAYDANGEITESNGIIVQRDAGGRITRLTLAPGKTIDYAYDAADRVTSVTDWLGGGITFSYDASGRPTTLTRSNGVNTSLDHNPDGWVVSIDHGSLGGITLTRDAAGQITAASRNLPEVGTAASLSNVSLSVDAANQLTDGVYDAAGRLTARGAETYDWDLASRLLRYTVGGSLVQASYDALGLRIARSEGGQTHEYVWNHALGQSGISIERLQGTDRYYYVHDPAGNLLYRIEAASGARQFYHYDEQGNTVLLSDDGGSVVASYAYSPFGRVIASTGVTDNPFTWQGRFGVMYESGDLYYMQARYYSAETGRFISRDPDRSIVPHRLNPYVYAANNPLLFRDSGGLAEQLNAASMSDATLRALLEKYEQRRKEVARVINRWNKELERREHLRRRANAAFRSGFELHQVPGAFLEMDMMQSLFSAGLDTLAIMMDKSLGEHYYPELDRLDRQIGSIKAELNRRESVRKQLREAEIDKARQAYRDAIRAHRGAIRDWLRAKSPEEKQALRERVNELRIKREEATRRFKFLQEGGDPSAPLPVESIVPELSPIVIIS